MLTSRLAVPGYGGSARSDIGILKHGLLSPSDVQSLFDLYGAPFRLVLTGVNTPTLDTLSIYM